MSNRFTVLACAALVAAGLALGLPAVASGSPGEELANVALTAELRRAQGAIDTLSADVADLTSRANALEQSVMMHYRVIQSWTDKYEELEAALVLTDGLGPRVTALETAASAEQICVHRQGGPNARTYYGYAPWPRHDDDEALLVTFIDRYHCEPGPDIWLSEHDDGWQYRAPEGATASGAH